MAQAQEKQRQAELLASEAIGTRRMGTSSRLSAGRRPASEAGLQGQHSLGGKEFLLLYDGRCPVCDYYCRRITIPPSEGLLTRVDARQSGELLREVTRKGLDIDQGMVLKVGGKLYYGAEAIHVLALLSTPSDLFNTINLWLFRSKPIANLLYPVLRAGRRGLLRLLGRANIDNLSSTGAGRF